MIDCRAARSINRGSAAILNPGPYLDGCASNFRCIEAAIKIEKDATDISHGIKLIGNLNLYAFHVQGIHDVAGLD